jgi:flagellar hook-associated protein 2
MLEKSAAQDALVKINGFDVTRPSNTITDAVDGLTLNLKAASPGTPVSVGVSLDKSAISKTVGEFVDAYNKLGSVIRSLGSYDAQSKEAGSLLGDSMLRNLQSQLRSDMGNPVTTATGEYNTLQMIGVEIDASGVMSLKQDKLEAALAVNVSTVASVFASSDGVAMRLDSRITSYVQSGGSLDSRTQSLNGTLREISNAREAQQLRLDKLEASLLKQFNAMDAMVAQFNATGAFLAQRFK